MASRRSKKVSDAIKMELGDILHTKTKDPDIGFVTITEVTLSDDLRMAKVYFSVLGDEDQVKKSIKGLERARLFLQSEVGSRINLRYLPELRFCLDKSWSYGERIDRLLESLKNNEQEKS
jgi:ribosome-binding factor A